MSHQYFSKLLSNLLEFGKNIPEDIRDKYNQTIFSVIGEMVSTDRNLSMIRIVNDNFIHEIKTIKSQFYNELRHMKEIIEQNESKYTFHNLHEIMNRMFNTIDRLSKISDNLYLMSNNIIPSVNPLKNFHVNEKIVFDLISIFSKTLVYLTHSATNEYSSYSYKTMNIASDYNKISNLLVNIYTLLIQSDSNLVFENEFQITDNSLIINIHDESSLNNPIEFNDDVLIINLNKLLIKEAFHIIKDLKGTLVQKFNQTMNKRTTTITIPFSDEFNIISYERHN